MGMSINTTSIQVGSVVDWEAFRVWQKSATARAQYRITYTPSTPDAYIIYLVELGLRYSRIYCKYIAIERQIFPSAIITNHLLRALASNHPLCVDLADTAIFCLPRKEVQQRAQRLSHKTETHPEDRVPNDLTRLYLLQWESYRDERYLEHHTRKSNTCKNVSVDARKRRWEYFDAPMMLCVGIPTSISCKMAENVYTTILAVRWPHPLPIRGENICLFMKRYTGLFHERQYTPTLGLFHQSV